MLSPEQAIEAIEDALRRTQKETFLVAIDGPCGGGKSTFAKEIQSRLGGIVIPLDDFFLPPERRTEERLSRPGENVDHERFLSEVLRPLSEKRVVSYSAYDCRRNELCKPKTFLPQGLFLVEGSYSFHPKLLPYYDLKIFVDVEKEEQIRRLRMREKERFSAFERKWIPMEERYFLALDPKGKADIIVRH